MSASGSFLSSLLDWLSRLLKQAPPPDTGVLTPLQPRVLLIAFNPIVDTSTGKRLVEVLRWKDPDRLAADYIADIQECSFGLVNYQIVERVQVDELPVKADAFQYQAQEYVDAIRTGSGFHEPDAVDYAPILFKFNLLERVAANEIDEVWLFAGPYAGFWESTMAGAGAFFCNSDPVPNTAQCPRRFVIMGFNYERGVGEMLEDLGHRAESILRQVYRFTRGDANLFERYARYDQVSPGQANVGLLHFAPNSVRDYDWGNMTPVPSCCDDWLHFPDTPDPPNYRMVDAREWGSGDIRAHHQWWFKHLPRAAGTTEGIANNWWKYIVQPDNVP